MVEVDSTGKTTFTFRHVGEGPVFVVGDFCHWHEDHLPMRRAGPQEWALMMRLPPGTYKFRYLAGGEWYTDYAAFGVERNPFQTWDAVLRVPKVRPPVRRTARLRVRPVAAERLVASA